jgi:hypothetical protein
MSTERKAGGRGKGRGFVLLYAVMTSTIILAVGVSIISIALKQLAISTVGRESQYAFYAANTGAECALYWDFHGVLSEVVSGGAGTAYERLAVFDNPFLESGREVVEPDDMALVECARTPLMQNAGEPTSCDDIDGWCEEECEAGSSDIDVCIRTEFTVFLGRIEGTGEIDQNGACARVAIEKERGTGAAEEFTPSASGSNLRTTVDSRGYNYCDPTNVRRVERGLRFTY